MYEYFDRQIKVLGQEAQNSLMDSKVLVLGCGALGSMTANLLARAGVNLKLVDRDIVEESNLHRTLFREKDIGRPKVEALKEVLEGSTDVDIETIFDDFNRFNAEDIISDVDIVSDCLDSMRSRYLLNEICVKENVPFVHGAIIRAEGRVKFFDTENGCFRCMYPKRPDPGSLETCSSSGVLNTISTLVSTVQSNTVIKYLTNYGEVSDDLFLFNLENDRFDKVRVDRNDDCEVCVGKNYSLLDDVGDIIIEETCEGFHVIPKEANINLDKISERYDGQFKGAYTIIEKFGKRIILYENGRMQLDALNREQAKKIYNDIVGF